MAQEHGLQQPGCNFGMPFSQNWTDNLDCGQVTMVENDVHFGLMHFEGICTAQFGEMKTNMFSLNKYKFCSNLIWYTV